MKCKLCKKPIKENTDGNKRYCQGHGPGDLFKSTCAACGNIFLADESYVRNVQNGKLESLCNDCLGESNK